MSAVPEGASLRLPPLELLYEEPGLPAFDLPEALAAAYTGSIGFPTPRLWANVTVNLGGVFARRGAFQPGESAGEHAHFLAGLLRACADAVLVSGDVGIGRLDMHLSAADAYPPGASSYAQLRRLRGCPPRPRPVVLYTGDAPGRDPPEFTDDTLVLATERRGRSLRRWLSAETALIELAASSVEPIQVVDVLRDRGYQLILCEGCPTFVGSFLETGVVDELFLTHAPPGAGGSGSTVWPDLGHSLPLDEAVPARLLSLRRGSTHFFARYELDGHRASGRVT
jgi:riboflavin biosynthesis pyrimidine reductase